MKNLFKNIALISVFLLSGSFAVLLAQDNCSDETTGKFCITVENPIQIDVDNDFIDAGEVCPGCFVKYTNCDCPNIIYRVTGGSNCYFSYQSFMPAENQGVGISIIVYYYDIPAKSWLRAKTNEIFSFSENGEALLKACVHEIWSDCTSSAGEYDFPLRLYVQYTCGNI
jgi:hypothetical protein